MLKVWKISDAEADKKDYNPFRNHTSIANSEIGTGDPAASPSKFF